MNILNAFDFIEDYEAKQCFSGGENMCYVPDEPIVNDNGDVSTSTVSDIALNSNDAGEFTESIMSETEKSDFNASDLAGGILSSVFVNDDESENDGEPIKYETSNYEPQLPIFKNDNRLDLSHLKTLLKANEYVNKNKEQSEKTRDNILKRKLVEKQKSKLFNPFAIRSTIAKDKDFNLLQKKDDFKHVKEENITNDYLQEMFDRVIDYFLDADNSLGDFARNFRKLQLSDTDRADKYFHAKANIESSQRGVDGIIASLAIGTFREMAQSIVTYILSNKSFSEIIEDAKADMDANMFGVYKGIKYPNKDPKELAKSLRPKELKKKYW